MPTRSVEALHPREFEVNQTWLAFRMNRLPVLTPQGEFDVFVLQDAASMFIFGSVLASAGAECPSREEVRDLLEQARSRAQTWPDELVLPGRPTAGNAFAIVAGEHGITVKAVAEARVSFYIKDVQASFEEFSAKTGKKGKRR